LRSREQASTSLPKLPLFVISRTLLILVGLLFALVVVEIALRIIPIPNRFTLMQRLAQQWESDDELLLHLKPNLNMRIYGHPEFSYTVRTNADGLRDEPFVGAFDVAAIGDSFTFGFGVEEEESWPTRLEAISGARVANLGWAGWNSHVYPAAIKRYAIPLGTRIWLWTFFGNDLPESVGAEDFLNSGEQDYKRWVEQNRMYTTSPPFPFNLRIVQLVTALIKPELFLLPDSGDRIFDNGELRMRVGRYAWETTDPDQPNVQRGWELTEAALIKAQDLAVLYDATLVVVFIPNREHVYWPYIKDVMKDADIRQLDGVDARLRDFCEAHGILYLSLLPGLRSRAMHGEMLYFPSDGHWNAAGHELASQLVYDMLLNERLLTR
jgi:hypothetical protein